MLSGQKTTLPHNPNSLSVADTLKCVEALKTIVHLRERVLDKANHDMAEITNDDLYEFFIQVNEQTNTWELG